MQFQHGREPVQYEQADRGYLNRPFLFGWIGRVLSVSWNICSIDVSTSDFSLRGFLKSIVCKDPVESEMDLVARNVCAADTIREKPGVFDHVRQ